jgi:hypothetical protein
MGPAACRDTAAHRRVIMDALEIPAADQSPGTAIPSGRVRNRRKQFNRRRDGIKLTAAVVRDEYGIGSVSFPQTDQGGRRCEGAISSQV